MTDLVTARPGDTARVSRRAAVVQRQEPMVRTLRRRQEPPDIHGLTTVGQSARGSSRPAGARQWTELSAAGAPVGRTDTTPVPPLVRRSTALYITGLALYARHRADQTRRCACCQMPWPCPAQRHTVAIVEAAGDERRDGDEVYGPNHEPHGTGTSRPTIRREPSTCRPTSWDTNWAAPTAPAYRIPGGADDRPHPPGDTHPRSAQRGPSATAATGP
jgi:hypothetical protein